jgi:hypothetical protein
LVSSAQARTATVTASGYLSLSHPHRLAHKRRRCLHEAPRRRDISEIRATSAAISAGANFASWITSNPTPAARMASSAVATSTTNLFSGAARLSFSINPTNGSLPRKAQCSGKSSTVSDKPSRCMTAPPALTAATAKRLVPGTLLRVHATAPHPAPPVHRERCGIKPGGGFARGSRFHPRRN